MPLLNLIDLATVCVAMHNGFKTNDGGETTDKIPIEMDPKDKPGEKTLRDRMPVNTSEEEKNSFKALFPHVDKEMKWGGKNKGGVPEKVWKRLCEQMLAAIDSTFYAFLDMMVDDLKPNSVVVFYNEGDNNDCPWTLAMLKAFIYYTDVKKLCVYVFFCKAKPSYKLLNPEFHSSWRNAVCKKFGGILKWKMNFFFLCIGADDDGEFKSPTKMLKETATTQASAIVVTVGSMLPELQKNSKGDFTAGCRLMLQTTAPLDDWKTVTEPAINDYVAKGGTVDAWLREQARKNDIRIELSTDSIFAAAWARQER